MSTARARSTAPCVVGPRLPVTPRALHRWSLSDGENALTEALAELDTVSLVSPTAQRAHPCAWLLTLAWGHAQLGPRPQLEHAIGLLAVGCRTCRDWLYQGPSC